MSHHNFWRAQFGREDIFENLRLLLTEYSLRVKYHLKNCSNYHFQFCFSLTFLLWNTELELEANLNNDFQVLLED